MATDTAGMHPRVNYAAAMERPPGLYPERNLAAEAAALAEAQMFDCTRFPGAVRLSERQCLINQQRAASSGFPSFCVDCPDGGEIKERHPEGVELKVHRQANAADRCLRVKRSRPEKPVPSAPRSPQPSPLKGEGEKKSASPVCAKHRVEMEQDKRPRYYCPQCRGEAHLRGIPRCPIHKVKKTADKRGRYRCEKCMSIGQRNRQQKEKGMKEVTLSSSPEGMEEKQIPNCLKHPGEKQLLDDQDRPSGICRLCLRSQKVQAARPGGGSAATGKFKLAAKLPDFDPSWSDDLKIKWFDVFKELCLMPWETGGGEHLLTMGNKRRQLLTVRNKCQLKGAFVNQGRKYQPQRQMSIGIGCRSGSGEPRTR